VSAGSDVTGEAFAPHALPGYIAWLRRQADGDEVTLSLLGLHKMSLVTPDYHDHGVQFDHWHVREKDPDLGELRAGRIRLVPGLFELHCRECRQPYPCRTTRLITRRYRDRTGYEDGWKL
jgi:hypothetical protein